ncbi:MAG TPA: hypothetical protein VG944_12305 [Fimbriimonas sp.]|nr:hypothetical protein [Fimbriimonas sp.]
MFPRSFNCPTCGRAAQSGTPLCPHCGHALPWTAPVDSAVGWVVAAFCWFGAVIGATILYMGFRPPLAFGIHPLGDLIGLGILVGSVAGLVASHRHVKGLFPPLAVALLVFGWVVVSNERLLVQQHEEMNPQFHIPTRHS